jgi:hypothetical protein
VATFNTPKPQKKKKYIYIYIAFSSSMVITPYAIQCGLDFNESVSLEIVVGSAKLHVGIGRSTDNFSLN